MAPASTESASPIGIANLPNQRHKIVAKRGAAFTIMVRRLQTLRGSLVYHD
jgi:cell division control protein 12